MPDRFVAAVRRPDGVARRVRLLPMVPLVAVVATVSGLQAVTDAGAATGTPLSGSYTNSAGTRSYLGYVPSAYHSGTPVPLVVALHGCTQNADVFRQLTQMNNLAESKGFIVVYPQQDSNANPMSCWNWFNSQDMQRGSGEPSLIAGITQQVEHQYKVDPNRVYLAGFSAGGAMADVMAATYPDLYSAVGIGSGLQYGGINPTLSPTQAGQQVLAAMGSHARAVPVLIFQGGQDNIVPPDNATKLVQQWQTTDNLITAGSFPAVPTQTQNLQSPGGQAYTVSHYADAKGLDMLQSWAVPSMSHAWSGGCGCQSYANPPGPDESTAMYSFFVNHPMSTGATGGSGLPLPGGIPPVASPPAPLPPVALPPVSLPPISLAPVSLPPVLTTPLAFPSAVLSGVQQFFSGLLHGWPFTAWPLSALHLPGLQ
jgi:poly(hydroxyalkanoate) depolymerase family esterase